MKKQKFKKIRGENKLLRNIEKWKKYNLFFDQELLKEYNYLTSKWMVRPWSDLLRTKYPYPEPNGEFREKIIESFIEIYKNWKTELDKLQVDYYLKIWIFFPNFRESQVVCAIGDKIDWYENVFLENDEKLDFPENEFSKETNELLSNFSWEHCSSEEVFDDNEVGEEDEYASKKDYLDSKKWFENFLKSEHRIYQFIDENKENKTYHYLKTDDVWVGEIKKTKISK